MSSLLRWWRRRGELQQIAARQHRLEIELAGPLGGPVQLVPAAAKGGYDEIFYAQRGSERLAVVRLNSPFKQQHDPIGPQDPGVPLPAAERLDREWDAYSRLAPLGRSPQPLWRTQDAIACSWINWGRASVRLTEARETFWPLLERALPLIHQMHAAGVIHLDLNWGNLLVAPEERELAVIDFEFGPVAWVTPAQQMAYDYLRLLDDSLKPRRGGRLLLADLPRVTRLLATNVPEEIRDTPLGFVFAKLQRLAPQAELRRKLATVFPRLNE